MRVFLVFLLLAAPQAIAQTACDDVWFTRNLHFDRAGYCFGSTLGKALFDNSDCTGTSVTLPPKAKAQVDAIRELEERYQCQIDTNRSAIDIDDLDIRRTLIDLPIRDEFESACLGWRLAPLSLWAGIGAQTPVTGQISPGDNVLFSFQPVDGWSYVTVHAHDFSALKTGGWVPDKTFVEETCDAWAG